MPDAPKPKQQEQMVVMYDGTTIEVPMVDGRYTLWWLARQWKEGNRREFEVRVGGRVVMSSAKIYLTPSECQYLCDKLGF